MALTIGICDDSAEQIELCHQGYIAICIRSGVFTIDLVPGQKPAAAGKQVLYQVIKEMLKPRLFSG